jgi:hypothetical protein
MMTNEEQTRSMLSNMDVPLYKLETTKSTVVQWLLANLRIRNVQHEKYVPCMELLLELATKGKWINKSKQREIQNHLDIVKSELNSKEMNSGDHTTESVVSNECV